VSFPFNAYVYALLAAFLCALLALPLWRRFCFRVSLVDDPGHRKIHSHPIPLAGGLTVLTGMLIPLVIGAAVIHWNLAGVRTGRELLAYGLNRRVWELGAIVLGAVGIVITGGLDDRFELPPAIKFVGQFLVAVLVTSANVRITLFVHNGIFSYALTILWILTVINALNFMDNMNGLCAGLGTTSVCAFALITASAGQYLVAGLGFLACGALLGFLPYNFPKAVAFLGDMGSHLVGYLLAVMAILPHFYTIHHPRPWAVFIPLLILAVPLGDLAYVVIWRWRIGQPFYQGDTNHWSHRLVKRGWSKPGAVLLICAVNALCGAIGVGLMLATR
jgi:UDP-GlcNAc:undecaprenyl-phosphate GlcNAc-1-phosphate transferase